MGRREITNGAFGVLVAGGIAMLIGATVTGPYQLALVWGAVASVSVGGIGLAWLWFITRRSLPVSPGDSFNNFGNNLGHMGPVNNFHGRKALQLTPDVLAEIVNTVGPGTEITVHAIGYSGLAMQDTIARALRGAGCTVHLDSTMIMAVRGPLTIGDFDGERTLFVAPDA